MQASPSDHIFSNPYLMALGYIALGGLLLLAFIFYQERTLFTDIPYQTVLMINEGKVQVQVFRFGAAIVQLLPLLAIKLELPISTILTLYSISFPLLYLFIFILIVHPLKNPRLGWALIFLFTLIIFDGFYWPSSEQQQGLAFLLLFFAVVLRFPALKGLFLWVGLVIGLLAIAYYHPLIFIPFYFLMVFFGWSQKNLQHRNFLLLGLLLFLILVLKSQFSSNYYDDGKYTVFFNNLIDYFPNYFSFPSHQKFLQHSLKFWYFLPLLFTVVMLFYTYHRKWLKAALVVTFCFGTLLLLHIGSPKASYRFYAEVNYMPLVIFLAVPFLFDIVPTIRSPKWVLLLFAIIIGIRLNTIYHNHRPFTQRIQWLQQTINSESTQLKTNRLWMYEWDTPKEQLIMSWSTAYETLLLSSIDGPAHSKTLVIFPEVGPTRLQQLQTDSLFHSAIRMHSVEEFNPKYFQINQGPYMQIK
ncbi:MAG: hypothetical protein AAF798_20620 [Bacteroidota bacterium]